MDKVEEILAETNRLFETLLNVQNYIESTYTKAEFTLDDLALGKQIISQLDAELYSFTSELNPSNLPEPESLADILQIIISPLNTIQAFVQSTAQQYRSHGEVINNSHN